MGSQSGTVRAARRLALAVWIGGALITVTSGSASAATADDETPAATPYRPSVSTPAALSAPGWIEVEAGLQHEHDEAAARRDSLPVTVKLAFTPDWGIRVGADAWVHAHDDATSASGVGDTSIIAKRRFAIDDSSAFGLEAGATLPTAQHGLGSGSGKPDWQLTAIHSADFASVWHSDVNVAATRLGSHEAGTARTQWLFAGALSRALDERWNVVGELSGTEQGGVEGTRQLLVAASYNVSRRLVVDAGAARSVRAGAPVWSAFTGFTWLAAHVF
ncbi:MAG TPA: transporter [Caldimonas sp.]|jgi:hypothetical protein|nr:transporter [Caldimonas sp.]HEX4234496.1 transporter [Caldimonas sp.]